MICPSQKTASGTKGGAGVKAPGISSLKQAIQDESMVIRADERERRAGPGAMDTEKN